MLFHRKLQVGFIVTATIVTSIFIEVYRNSNRLENTRRAIVETQQILFENEDLFSALVDLETRSRGYAITGNEAYIRSYELIHQELFNQLEKFKKLTASNQLLKTRSLKLDALVHTKANFSNKVVRVTKTSGVYGAKLLLSSGIGIKYMNDVREVILDVERHEKKILSRRIAQNEQEVKYFHILLVVSLMLIMLILIVMIYLISINSKARIRAEEEMKKQTLKVEEMNNELKGSIAYASRLQISMLSNEKELTRIFPKSFAINKPKDIVSGDFFMVEEKDNKKIVAVADCTGHGVPGAFMSILGYTGLKNAMNEYSSCKPDEILNGLNRFIKSNFQKSENQVQDGMDIALFCLDEENKTLTFSGGHNSLWHVKKNILSVLKGDKQPIGNYSHSKSFSSQTISVEKGDRLFLFTDGIYDQFGGPDAKKMKQKGLLELIKKTGEFSIEKQKERILNHIKEWQGSIPQLDDICMMGIEIA